MDNLGIGAGLAAVAFWSFVAVAVIASVWNGIRKRDAEHETLRRLLESGYDADSDVLDKLTLIGGDADRRPDRELKVTAFWVLPVAAGMVIMALVLGAAVPEALVPLLGVAGLLACMGFGWLIAAKVAGRWYAANDEE